MHCLVYLAFAIMTVYSCESCSIPVQDVCNSEENFPTDFPDTVEELVQSCNDLRDVARCYQNYNENCAENDHKNETPDHKNEKYFKYVQEKCQEDSDEFQVISRNLDCFTPTIKSLNGECFPGYIDEEDYEDLLNQSRNVFDGNSFNCLEAMWLITCMSRTMGERCGPELTDVLSGILENINYDYVHKCDTENLSDFSSFKEAVERVVSEGKWLENAGNVEDN